MLFSTDGDLGFLLAHEMRDTRAHTQREREREREGENRVIFLHCGGGLQGPNLSGSALKTTSSSSEEMGSAKICHYSNRNGRSIISLLFLLLSSSTLLRFVADGRAISKLLEAAQREVDDEKVVVMRTQVIGSTPPRCEGMCSTCGHCEAVQVPVTTEVHEHSRTHLSAAPISNIASSRGDDVSNYKPMSWKCKCGDLIFNP
ncbi:EPIDERMAL PATTERNING FACTOR-like protein 2 isoform X2 [Hevea brasiliensis]|uniref:EPIDERMAL PATTERNING FACTOR-like protein 2 isoform X2 n=1 Tax=Hevea brasiliensis TaxID=3981 RepID=UPI0025F3B593|nr:EPIDERMAL PATTERNING FACTOR-like protein 2 isoform X2 [Hevea brasiliensis]XP_057990451.1 EPIDERMAL PATTERNING FACTOR-like protein 2 isoform X2 [Hevea brasiliensis]